MALSDTLSPADRERLRRLIVPRTTPYIPHVPHAPQQLFLTLNHKEEVFFGGAAGGGKSDALLMSALQYVDVPGYAALLLRRTWPDLSQPGAILDRAGTWLGGTDARPRQGGRIWEFPTSNPDLPARIIFGHMQYEKDKYSYQGSELHFVGFDELTQFSKTMYEYLFSRLRKPQLICVLCQRPIRWSTKKTMWIHRRKKNETIECTGPVPDTQAIQKYKGAHQDGMTLFDVPMRMRSASNPGGFGHQWVKERFIDVVTKEPDGIFVPSRVVDNPSINQIEYLKSLNHLGPVDRERLLNGDWDVEEESGWFQRWWWKVVDVNASPPGRVIETVRYWDLAATKDGDWTAGVKMHLLDDGTFWIDDVQHERLSPREVERLIENTAIGDGPGVTIAMEQEPGSSGVNTIDNYARNILPGYDFRAVKNTGAKQERVRPLSSAAEKGNVYVTKAHWNVPFIDEAALFPHGQFDDMVDAAGGALQELVFGRRARIIV